MKTKTTRGTQAVKQALLWALCAVVASTAPDASAESEQRAGHAVKLPGLYAAAGVMRDEHGIAHVQARNDHDLYFLQGYETARDRLFQMDMLRRLGSGTFAELAGSAALPTDVQLRTMGLRRAAERTMPVLSRRTRAALQAYAEGVNAWAGSHPLPPEYGALEITKFEPWTALDSITVAKLIAFDRSFELDVGPTVTLMTYQQAGQVAGFDGASLYSHDLFRVAPFNTASTILDASVSACAQSATPEASAGSARRVAPKSERDLTAVLVALCRHYLNDIRDLPAFEGILNREMRPGSNEWVVDSQHTESGRPILANDPHLLLGTPALIYPIHLSAPERNVIGYSFPGVPFVILGHNQFIAWGGTVNYVDVTDTFQEQVVPDTASPSGLSTVYNGHNEPLIPVPQVFRVNQFDGLPDNPVVAPAGGGIPPVTLIVPRRNNGPIINLDQASGIALSVQFTGFGPSRELDTFEAWNRARNLDDFRRGLQHFDVGSLNWAYADVHGNIAYFSGGEVPVREDLQAGTINGLPPTFVRNGTGGNEWLPMQHPQPGQVSAYEVLPLDEMPQVINPPAGWFVNANNDPLGHTFDNNAFNQVRPDGGIYYLSAGYETIRAGRIKELIADKLANGGRISFADMEEIQADTVLPDAEFFVPQILTAWANAQASGEPTLTGFVANTRLAEAVRRLRAWNFTTPTGIPEGYDASDRNGQRLAPTSAELANSVTATIYSVWRGQIIHNTLDAPLAPAGLPVVDDLHALAALRNLFDEFPARAGVGASGLDFFHVPGVASAADRRDILILKSLGDALERLAGEPFAPVFAKSTNLDDYRWGKLHRLVLAHPLGGPFNIPPAGGAFPPPLPGLDGIPADGGFGSVDAAPHDLRADHAHAFVSTRAPTMRLVAQAGPGWVRGVSSLAGGVSGVLGSPRYANLLPGWLTNESFRLWTRPSEVLHHAEEETTYVPAGECEEER